MYLQFGSIYELASSYISLSEVVHGKERESMSILSIDLQHLCSRRGHTLQSRFREYRGARAAHDHLHLQRSDDPRRAGAAQDGTCRSSPWGVGFFIDVHLQHDVEDEDRVRSLAEGLGAKLQLLERFFRAPVASPVLFQEHLAAADVVWLLLSELATVGPTESRTKGSDVEVFAPVPTLTIALVAVNANVEGIELTAFV